MTTIDSWNNTGETSTALRMGERSKPQPEAELPRSRKLRLATAGSMAVVSSNLTASALLPGEARYIHESQRAEYEAAGWTVELALGHHGAGGWCVAWKAT